jgi:hypothetical protein
MAIGCCANWLRNRTLHCVITGPLFLIVGFLLLLSDLNAVQVTHEWLWPSVVMGVGFAFLLEWRYTQPSAKG